LKNKNISKSKNNNISEDMSDLNDKLINSNLKDNILISNNQTSDNNDFINEKLNKLNNLELDLNKLV
jgi:hypothetical protein